MRVALIIPALNEAECIGPLVLAARSANPDVKVYVVDNGSTDGTGLVAAGAGAHVVSETRRGYGYACAAGVAAATADGHDVLAFLDGDGSQDPGELGRLLQPILTDRADLVLGSRVLGGAGAEALMAHQRAGNALVLALIRQLYGLTLTDLAPFKAISTDVLASLDMQEMTYGWTVEMIVKCARRRRRVVEQPATARARAAGASKVSGTLRGSVLAAYHLLRTVFRYARS